MVIVLIYIGAVVLLHILGKVNKASPKVVMEGMEDPAESGDM